MGIRGTKLDQAFKMLRKAGFVARANFCCCSSCAGAKFANEMEEIADKSTAALPKGLVFYHRQDAAGVSQWEEYGRNPREDGGLCLRFSHVATAKYGEFGSMVEVGRTLVEALQAAGCTPEWDGNPNLCVIVQYSDAFAPATSVEKAA